MSQEPIDLRSDYKRLVDEGYTIKITSGYILIEDIPYVNSGRQCKIGTLVCPITMGGEYWVKPETHVIFFKGEYPCNYDGSKITSIEHESRDQDLGNSIVINHSFSNKPNGGFLNYYDKIKNYINIIFSPVHILDSNLVPTLRKPFECDESDTYKYYDTNTTKGNLGTIVNQLESLKIGIVGLGGTGSYLLDFIAKTPVKEIHLFDHDKFYSHNAFRAPGAPSIDILNEQPSKVDYFSSIYSNMRRNIVKNEIKVSSENIECLYDLSFIFLCVDSGLDKKIIIEKLIEREIPFIDTGIGINICNASLMGSVRVTTLIPKVNDNWENHINFVNSENDLYETNIQISEINCLAAVLAIIKWKKYYGIYTDLNHQDFSVYDISMNEIVNES